MDDPIVLDTVLTEGGWFERFLADRGPLLPEDEAALAATWVPVRRTVFQVTAVRPAERLTVRDLRSDERFDVRERIFSRQAQTGQMVCGRVVPDGETSQFVGGLFMVPPGTEAAVLALCDEGTPEDICTWVAAMDLGGARQCDELSAARTLASSHQARSSAEKKPTSKRVRLPGSDPGKRTRLPGSVRG